MSNWVRFLILFVENSARFKCPQNFNDNRTSDQIFPRMFEWVVKDRGLLTYYEGRKEKFMFGGEENACCDCCSHGGSCSLKVA